MRALPLGVGAACRKAAASVPEMQVAVLGSHSAYAEALAGLWLLSEWSQRGLELHRVERFAVRRSPMPH